MAKRIPGWFMEAIAAMAAVAALAAAVELFHAINKEDPQWLHDHWWIFWMMYQ